jgi:hypothetical protein
MLAELVPCDLKQNIDTLEPCTQAETSLIEKHITKGGITDCKLPPAHVSYCQGCTGIMHNNRFFGRKIILIVQSV